MKKTLKDVSPLTRAQLKLIEGAGTGGQLGSPCKMLNVSIPLTVCMPECITANAAAGECAGGLKCCIY